MTDQRMDLDIYPEVLVVIDYLACSVSLFAHSLRSWHCIFFKSLHAGASEMTRYSFSGNNLFLHEAIKTVTHSLRHIRWITDMSSASLSRYVDR